VLVIPTFCEPKFSASSVRIAFGVPVNPVRPAVCVAGVPLTVSDTFTVAMNWPSTFGVNVTAIWQRSWPPALLRSCWSARRGTRRSR